MNILFISDYFLPHAGGARVYYFNLYKELLAYSDQVTVLTKEVPGCAEFDRQECRDRLRIVRRFKPLPNWKYHQLPKIVFPLVEAFHLIRKHNVDLIHFGDLYPPGVISLALKRWLGLPYLAYCHGEEITQTDRCRYQPRVRDLVYRQAAAVVAANEFARQNLLRIGIADSRIYKITPGVDCERFQPRPANPDFLRRFGLEGKTVLLTVGRICRRKNHKAVLAALKRLLPDVPRLKYLIVGKGEDEPGLRRLIAEEGLGNVVTFVNYAPEDQLAEFYNAADLFVMPNRAEANGDIEGFGMVFLEANAAGKPVIGGRSGGTTEAIVHGVTGFLVDPDNVEELAESIRLLSLNPDLRQRMGHAGRCRARAEFNWSRGAELLHQISSDIVGRRSPAQRAVLE